ncbi:unnamed protein product [Caenorhabditis nigoni]
MEVFDAPSFVKVFTSFWKLAIPLFPLNLIQTMVEMSATAKCTSVDQARVKIEKVNFLVRTKTCFFLLKSFSFM